nr:unnamed protein product [Callosobruchus analis]
MIKLCSPLNTNKCAVIYFGSNKLHAAESLTISVNNEELPGKAEVKNLGLLLDIKLRFRAQVNKVQQAAFRSLHIPSHKTSLYKRSFTYSATAVYNEVPFSLRSLSFAAFKHKYREVLLKC